MNATWGARQGLLSVVLVAVILGTTGAESGGCAPQQDGNPPVSAEGNQPSGTCRHTITPPQVTRKKITGTVRTVCAKSPLNHKITLHLEKRGPNGSWSEVRSQNDDKAPGAGRPKVSTVKAPCTAGVYRLRFEANILMPKAASWDYGRATDNRLTAVSESDCR